MKLALSIALLLSAHAEACSVPVFRYALEHWAADPYQVIVTHGGQLTDAQQRWLKKLTGAPLANVSVKVNDTPGAAPTITVKHPASLHSPQEVWTAPLTQENVEALLDSPVRQDIATRLGEGDSAVWVLLESGDKAQDEAAAEVLAKHLAHLSETLELPKLDAQDIKNGLVSLPDEGLRLTFPVIRLARSNPVEQFLVQSLLATEPDLKDRSDPMAFAIFGRGRVLYSLVGKGINADNIGHAATFLIGSCSCQIKEQNPGVDLIMSADWKKLLGTNALLDDPLPKLSDIEGLKPVLVPIPERPVKPVASTLWLMMAGGIALVFIVLMGMRARRA